MKSRWPTTLLSAGVWTAFFWFAVPAIIGLAWPVSFYITGPQGTSPWTVIVEDAVEGDDEHVLSDRVMVRDHIRDLHVTVTGVSDEAKGYFCDRSVLNLPAVAGSVHPPNMTLRRFMAQYREPPSYPCDPRPPGTYTMSEVYVIHGPLGSRIKVTLPPATFTVHPKGWTESEG